MSRSARFAELRQLVLGDDGFTREEIRYMKILLSNIHTDLISEFPLEIVALIALQLPPPDFASCLRVSRTWRQRLLSHPVISAYARRFWPAMTDGKVERDGFLHNLARLGWAEYSFQTITDARDANFEFVSWESNTHYQLDPQSSSGADRILSDYALFAILPDADDTFPALYASGKVAWHLKDCVVFVDDLQMKTRKVLTPPSGTMHGLAFELEALGSQLVVGTIDRVLVAWNHVDNQAYEKSLPCRIIRCITQDKRVAVTLRGGDIVVWTPGHTAFQLNTSPLVLEPSINSRGGMADDMHVCFDPRDNKATYVICGYFSNDGAKNILRISVYQFSAANHVASWSHNHEYQVTGAENYLQLHMGHHDSRLWVSDYEFDHSCIFIGRRSALIHDPWSIVFDKIGKRFIDLSQIYEWSWTRYLHFLKMRGGIDLDFKVNFTPSGYEVVRSKSPPPRRDQ